MPVHSTTLLTDLRFVKQIHFVARSVQQRIDNPQSPTAHPSVLQWAAVAEMSHLLPFWIKLPFIIYPELIWKSQRNEKWGRSFSQGTPLYFFFPRIALSTKADISANFNLATEVLPFLSPLPAKHICEPLTPPWTTVFIVLLCFPSNQNAFQWQLNVFPIILSAFWGICRGCIAEISKKHLVLLSLTASFETSPF